MTSRHVTYILGVVAAHWSISMGMVFINKHLVGDKERGNDISVFIVWIQNLVGALIFYLSMNIKTHFQLTIAVPQLSLTELTHQDMILSSMTFAGTLIFNNLMLKYISVAFYQVARSLTMVFIIGFSVIVLKEKITKNIFFSCGFIILGFYVALDEEILNQGVKMIGILYGIIASLMAALSGVFFKRFQNNMKVTSMQLTFNNCFICSITLLPLVISSGQLNSFMNSTLFHDAFTWLLLTVSGGMSLAMGWVTALQIQLTSPLSHNISINAKSLTQTLLAVAWSGKSRPAMWWLGNGFVMIGIGVYTGHKLNQEKNSLNKTIFVDAKD